MGSSSGQTSQQTQSQSSPWAPTQPELKNIISQLSGVNTAVSPYQQSALNQIQTNAQGLPNYGGAVNNLVGNQLSGIPNQNQMIGGAYGQVSGALSPQLQSNFLNPLSNPFTQGALNTTNQDITNQIQSQFAGAGQSFGPAEAQALARGLGQGESGILMNQFNTNAGLQQGAASGLMGAAQGANNAYSGNAQAGIGNIGNIASATNLAPLSQLSAAQAAYNLPLTQLGSIENMTLPIAGLGGQTQGTSFGQSQYNPSLLGQIGQGVGILGGLFG